MYGPHDAEQAWNRRWADLRSLDDVAQKLTKVDRRIDELNQQASALVTGDFDDYALGGRVNGPPR